MHDFRFSESQIFGRSQLVRRNRPESIREMSLCAWTFFALESSRPATLTTKIAQSDLPVRQRATLTAPPLARDPRRMTHPPSFRGARKREPGIHNHTRSRFWLIAAALISTAFATAARADPETVFFKSADGATDIVGYLFRPAGAGPHPAIVMLHGRAGPYSANDNAGCTLVARGTASACNASTLSKRHAMWGEFWAARGVLALLPDSFGPRGKAHGFPRFSHEDPDRDSVNEKTVRPLDAEGALAYLRARDDVTPDRIVLQGWSNGGSTALNVMIRQGAKPGFRAALAFYPGCGRAALLENTVVTSAPITMFLGTDDEEVSPAICQHVAQRSIDAGTKMSVALYPGATHDFDDPGEKRQGVPGNVAAKADAMGRVAGVVEGIRD
jgi:carboxymethylenebutenolidase